MSRLHFCRSHVHIIQKGIAAGFHRVDLSKLVYDCTNIAVRKPTCKDLKQVMYQMINHIARKFNGNGEEKFFLKLFSTLL